MAKYFLTVLTALVFCSGFAKAETIALPSCEDKNLLSLIDAMVNTYQEQNPVQSLVDKRKYLLVKKDLSVFEPIPVVGFVPKTDYNVANRILMAKINDGLKESDMRLCRSSNRLLERPVYIFMKPYDGKVWVELVNFLPQSQSDRNFYAIL